MDAFLTYLHRNKYKPFHNFQIEKKKDILCNSVRCSPLFQ